MNSEPPTPPQPLEVSASELLVSVAIAPLLIGLVAGKTIAALATQLGTLSEELFRGDRLPILQTPTNPDELP